MAVVKPESLILIIELICLVAGLLVQSGLGDDMDDEIREFMDNIDKTWMDEEPNTSGFKSCRICTREYNQLLPPEQKFWKEIANLNLKRDETALLMGKLFELLVFQDLAIESENLETNSRYLESDRQEQIKHTKYLQDQVDKFLNEIPHSAHELLEFYLNDNQLNSEEVKQKINSIYDKLMFVPSWQAYEAQNPEESPIRSSKPVNSTKDKSVSQKDEL